jgi:endonuclease/exonuclease/phosphatase family metal-dependent hydrolase
MGTINPLIVTYNCGRELAKPHVFARHILQASGVARPELIVLSLQEIAPIAYSYLGGAFLTSYLERFDHTIDIVAKSWSTDDDCRYLNLATRNVGMTAIMVFVRVDLVDRVRWIETGGVGVGWYDTGNKGCVGIRVGYETAATENTELTFLAAHLAPMEERLERRNQDWKDIVKGVVFTPSGQHGARDRHTEEEQSLLGDTSRRTSQAGIYDGKSYVFVAGDLNYRTADTKPDKAGQSRFPQPVEEVDPLHFSNLLKHDQLSRELEAGNTLHGFQEPSIHFPPTYKYSDDARKLVAEIEDGGNGISSSKQPQWGWALHRWPSWCDRILYLDLASRLTNDESCSKVTVNKYISLPLMSTSDHQPVLLSLSLPVGASQHPTEDLDDYKPPPFKIDPLWRQKRASARWRELAVGVLAYLGLTWEGNGIMLATVLGALGGWAIVRSMLVE